MPGAPGGAPAGSIARAFMMIRSSSGDAADETVPDSDKHAAQEAPRNSRAADTLTARSNLAVTYPRSRRYQPALVLLAEAAADPSLH